MFFFLSEIIASEDVAINCFSAEENTSHWQSNFQQKVLGLSISLRETLSN